LGIEISFSRRESGQEAVRRAIKLAEELEKHRRSISKVADSNKSIIGKSYSRTTKNVIRFQSKREVKAGVME
jgi:hypothetical protein